MAHHQADQITIYAATPRYSQIQSARVICYRLQHYRPYCKVFLVRHYEIYSKIKCEAQFRYHRKRRYDRIF